LVGKPEVREPSADTKMLLKYILEEQNGNKTGQKQERKGPEQGPMSSYFETIMYLKVSRLAANFSTS
jgi:hypothetical protein